MIWLWVALWVVLLVGAVVVLGVLGLDVWRKGRALMAEWAVVAERMAEASAPLQEAADELEERREELAVFTDPAELRRARTKAAKGRGGADSARRLGGRHRSGPASTRFGATSEASRRPGGERTT